MDNQALSQLDSELKHAGEGTTLSPLMLQLEQLRITPDRQLPKMVLPAQGTGGHHG